MVFLYQLFIKLYVLGIRTASLWSPKAAEWINGRKNLIKNLEQHFPINDPVVWVHSASAGEFEQAKPVIEELRKHYPNHKILITFFSPSGYHVGKKWKGADFIYYLPADTESNARRFIQLVKPQLVVFVKYDYWYYHLKEIKDNNIPLLLVSAIFRENSIFFKSYGSFHRKMLHFFTHLFVQDAASHKLLQQIGVHYSTISGDTRFDRVAQIEKSFTEVPLIDSFIENHKVLVAGSTWPDDESALATLFPQLENLKWIIAPHEINEPHLKGIEALFPDAIRYSKIKEAAGTGNKNADYNFLPDMLQAKVLIIDNIGTLSRLYHYAAITYIGGGFNKSGIHNTLEAAVYGKPVLFGPNYQKFKEAKELIAAGGAFSYRHKEELKNIIQPLLQDPQKYKAACTAAYQYVQQQRGATQKIMQYIQENRLLTRL